ncbi:MAG: zinc-ribbon domain-containing protein [Candidatus Bathyarchaeia archaeon]
MESSTTYFPGSFCTQCGLRLRDDSSFCASCGRPRDKA